MSKLVKTKGLTILWRGLGPTLWRDVPFSGKLLATLLQLKLTNRSILGRIRDSQDSFRNNPPRPFTPNNLLYLRRSLGNIFRPPDSTFRCSKDPSTSIHTFAKLFTCSTQFTCLDDTPCHACNQDGRVRGTYGWIDGEMWEGRAGLWTYDHGL
jgi:hypothetical protein